jgi:hypothetical protein
VGVDDRAEPPAEEYPEKRPDDGDVPLEEFYGQDDIFGLKLSAPRPAPKVPPKRARTATGALLTGIALGLRDVFDPEKKQDTVAIEQEAPAEPEGPQVYEIRLRSSPRDSQAIYRPWVKEDGDQPE